MSELILPAALYKGLLSSDGLICEFMKSPYAVQYLLSCSVLDTEVLYKSRIHGQGHIERVLLLGALIAYCEKLSLRETRLLLFACSYHDIGRIDDSRDDLHGRRSAELIVKKGLVNIPGDLSPQEIALLKASITTHSMHDESLDKNMELFGVLSENKSLCRKVCFCLKDADNLDRVRLGDLDPGHLRHDSSRAMPDTAKFIFDTYSNY